MACPVLHNPYVLAIGRDIDTRDSAPPKPPKPDPAFARLVADLRKFHARRNLPAWLLKR